MFNSYSLVQFSHSNRWMGCCIESLIYKAVENLKKLDLLYLNSDVKGKREIISSTFPEKWTFEDGEHRTKKVNEAILLIDQINSSLPRKKNRIKF